MPDHIYIRLFQMLIEELERVEYKITQGALDRDKCIRMFFELSDNAINMAEKLIESIKDDKQRMKTLLEKPDLKGR